jgi:hypothetical protein
MPRTTTNTRTTAMPRMPRITPNTMPYVTAPGATNAPYAMPYSLPNALPYANPALTAAR